MEDKKKEVFDMYFAAAVQGLLANEQCTPYADAEMVALKASRIAVEMLKKREQLGKFI